MDGNNKIPRLINGVSISEIKHLLDNGCAFSDEQKKHILSIFNELSFQDGVLSKSDWDMYTDLIDLNHDGKLSNYERSKSYEISQMYTFGDPKKLKLTTENAVNFYNLLSKYISERGGEVPEKVVNELNKRGDKSNIKDIICDKNRTYVKFVAPDGEESYAEYDKLSGKCINEIVINPQKNTTTIIVSCENGGYEVSQIDKKLAALDVFKRKDEIGKETKIFISARNQYRITPHADELFTGNWLCYDKHRSSTLEEFMENLKDDGLQYDKAGGKKLAQTAAQLGSKGRYEGDCPQHVFRTLQNVRNYLGERLSNGLNAPHAYQNALQFSQSENFREIPYNIVSTMDLTDLPPGCIIVYDAHYKESLHRKTPDKRYHKHGHISITDGTERAWGGGYYPIYDNLIKDAQKTHIRVFMPVMLYEKPIPPQPILEEQEFYPVKPTNLASQNCYEDDEEFD